MPVSISAQGAIGIRKEASFASGGLIDSWQVVEQYGLTNNVSHVYQDRIRTTPEQIGGRASHSMVSGPIVFPVSPQGPTQWWECGIGGTGPYTPQRPLSSMAIEAQLGSIGCEMSSGDMIGRLEFSSRQGDILRCNLNIEAKDMDARTPTTIPSGAFPSGDDPYLHSEATFTMDGVANPAVTAFSVALENNLITDLLAVGRARRDIPATKAVVSGSISILFENTTYRDRFMNQLPSSIVALYSRGAKSFKIELNRLAYDSDDKPMQSQSDYIVETLNFTAYVDDPTAQNSMKVTVV